MRVFKVLEGNQRRDQRLSFIMGSGYRKKIYIGRKSSSEINHFWLREIFWLRELISWDLYPREIVKCWFWLKTTSFMTLLRCALPFMQD